MKKIFKDYIRPYWKSIGLILLLSIIEVALQTSVITLTKRILNHGITTGNLAYTRSIGFAMLGMTLLYGLLVVAVAYLSARVSAGVTCDVRRGLFCKILTFSQTEYDRFGGATLMARITADTTRIQIFMINFLRNALLAPLVIVALMIATALINRLLCLVLFGAFVIIIVFMVLQSKRSIPFFNSVQKKLDTLNLLMKEKIDGARTIRAFHRQGYETERFEGLNAEYKEESYQAALKLFYLSPVAMILMNLAVLLVYFLGSLQLRQHLIEVTDLILFFQYVTYFISCLGIVPFIVTTLPKTVVSMERLAAVLYTAPAPADEPAGKTCGAPQSPETLQNPEAGTLEFRNVCFGYGDGKNVLENISFTVKAGSTVAFLGPTGAGKTTLLNLITRGYEVRSGEILLDGKNIRAMDAHTLRKAISYATQRTSVLAGTVYENVAMGHEMPERQVQDACELTLFSEALQQMPEGIHTEMERGGMNVSGGQKQRLSLARCVAKPAEVYLFDDCFSALDANTEKQVRHNIAEHLAGKTVLMVAQKINTICNADQILVLEHGKIVQQGTHAELLQSGGLYREIYETQSYAAEVMG